MSEASNTVEAGELTANRAVGCEEWAVVDD